MAPFQTFTFSAIILLHLTAYTVWQLQWRSHERLLDWLTYQRSADMIPTIHALGIWSVEEIAAKNISTLPYHIRQDKKLYPIYWWLKDKACTAIMLPLWLKDHGLDNYAELHDYEDLIELSKKYPGEIFHTIQGLRHLQPAQRVSLRKDVHHFKTTTREFASHPKSAKLLAHIEKYGELITSWNWLYSHRKIEDWLQANEAQWSHAICYISVSVVVLWMSLPEGPPLHGSFVIPLLATYWFVPEWGRLNILTMLLLRSFKEPARMLFISGVLYVWMMAADDAMMFPHILLLSVLPTLAFALCINSIRCQPSVTEEESSDLYDLTLSGIGYIEKEARHLANSRKVPWLYSKLAAVKITTLELEKVQRIKLEEVDVPWSAVKEILKPSIKAEKLKVIWLADNYAITDADAKSIGQLITENKSIDTLRITFNRKPPVLDRIYHLLLWNQNQVRFTNEGAMAVLETISKQEENKIQTLDLCGVHLKQGFVKMIKDSPKLKKMNILVKKGLVTERKTNMMILSYILNKLCLLLILFYTLSNIYNILHPSEIRISSNTWLSHAVQEIVYPNVKQFLQPYLQDVGLAGFVSVSKY